MAIRTLLPEVRTIVARLIYLADEPAKFELRGDELDGAINEATAYLVAAVEILRKGRIAPRWEQDALYDDMRLALPADRESYLRRKARISGLPIRRSVSFGMPHMTLVDEDNRRRAMTDFESVLLVEAAAGNG